MHMKSTIIRRLCCCCLPPAAPLLAEHQHVAERTTLETRIAEAEAAVTQRDCERVILERKLAEAEAAALQWKLAAEKAILDAESFRARYEDTACDETENAPTAPSPASALSSPPPEKLISEMPAPESPAVMTPAAASPAPLPLTPGVTPTSAASSHPMHTGRRTSRVAVGNRVEAMETSGGSNGINTNRFDPLAASRLSSSAQSSQRTLVRADSVSRESVVSAASFIERLEGRQRSQSMASPSSSAAGLTRRRESAAAATSGGASPTERQLESAREAAIAEAARADKAEEQVVTLESKVAAAQVEAEALRAQLANLTHLKRFSN